MMPRARVAFAVTLAMLGISCGSGDQGRTSEPSEAAGTAEGSTSSSDTTSGFGDPALAGLCEDSTVEIAVDEPAAPTRSAAIELFLQDHAILEETVIQGTDIVYDGKVVGQFDLRESPAGGFYVETAEWCYPE